ncbi:hypothetical protein SUGI_0428380 [Cryptomeria japonica]|nr:hypothetical protein SUGI_0428380 [Cryptomeria japonica]
MNAIARMVRDAVYSGICSPYWIGSGTAKGESKIKHFAHNIKKDLFPFQIQGDFKGLVMALKVLSALDGAKTQLYHFSAILIAGMGFFTDAYDLFCIPPVSNLLGKIYYGKDNGGLLPIHVKALVSGTALCGALIGQLFFGWLGDRMG